MSSVAYDQIAEEYKTSKQLPFRKHIEAYTLFDLLGDLNDKSILDLACGEGIYARQFKASGARTVLGVDVSTEMIKLAEAEELKAPMGCQYQVANASSFNIDSSFDVITGVYLLNYAKSRQELFQFCEAVYRHLKPGARFVGINDNPFNSPERYHMYKPYGLIKESPENRQEGDYIRYTLFNADGTECTFDNYYLSPETYEEVFTAVGFKRFSWHWPRLAPEQLSNTHWHYFMDYPPIIGFSAIR